MADKILEDDGDIPDINPFSYPYSNSRQVKHIQDSDHGPPPTFDVSFRGNAPRLVIQNDYVPDPGGGGGENHATSSENSQDQFLTGQHCHVKRREETSLTARNQLIAVTVLSTLFMIAEIVGGMLSNSLALITDATHLASDVASFIISLVAIHIAQKKPSRRLSFGFYRAEVIGALVSVLIIWVITGVLVYLAVRRIMENNFHIHADEMLITAGCGVAFNIIMGIVLHTEMFKCNIKTFGHNHSHGGGHGHSHSNHVDNDADESSITYMTLESPVEETASQNHRHSHGAKKKKNINVRAAFIHVIGDLIQSIGVLIAAYIIKYMPEAKLADPVCTFVFSILVLITTATVLRDACLIIMEAFPHDVPYKGLSDALQSIEGVKGVHNLHVWSLTMDKHAMSAHITTDTNAEHKDVLMKTKQLLQKKFDFFNTTIQVEQHCDTVQTDCYECQGPPK